MHKLRFIPPGAAVLLLASCIYEPVGPPINRYGQASGTIWERAPADSGLPRHPVTGLTMAPRPERYQAYPQNPYAGGYRVYTGVTGIPDTTRLHAPAPGLYSRRDALPGNPDYGSSRTGADSSRRLTGPTVPGTVAPKRELPWDDRGPLREATGANRRAVTTAPPVSAADRLASASAPKGASPQPRSPSEPAPSSRSATTEPSRLPLAQPVAGRTGYVRLPGHANLPEIDVRGIAPGTPVEVPDPARPGQTIQFRVP